MMDRPADSLPDWPEAQHAYAQSAHRGCTFEVRASTRDDGLGSHVHVVVRASPTCPHDRSADYVTEDATVGSAVRSGVAIAQAMIEDQVQ